jgi:hypothetical protein
MLPYQFYKMEDDMETATERRQEQLAQDEVGSLISADKVQGTNLYNRNGDDLGEVESIMIDKPSGKVAYAVIAFGGFLGMGQERRALPWSALHYDTEQRGYVVDAGDDVIKSTPAINDNYGDRNWGSRLHQHYGVPPYWI